VRVRSLLRHCAGADGRPLAGARVAIDGTMVTSTDGAGRYAFSGLRPGLVAQLDAVATGFAQTTTQVTVPNDAHADTDVTLEPSSGDSPRQNDSGPCRRRRTPCRALHGDGEFWALADRSTIPVVRAQQVGVWAGADVSDVRIDGRAYYKRFDGLTTFAPRLFPGIAPETNTDLSRQGSGRAVGLQFSLQYNVPRNSLWTTYGLGRVEYTYPTLEASTFSASFDRTHDLKIADLMRMGASWTIRAAFMVATGRPETPAQGVEPVWFPSGDTVYRVAFGAKNSVRLPVPSPRRIDGA
jgi:Carboxypeptidase regulatory-like domain